MDRSDIRFEVGCEHVNDVSFALPVDTDTFCESSASIDPKHVACVDLFLSPVFLLHSYNDSMDLSSTLVTFVL